MMHRFHYYYNNCTMELIVHVDNVRATYDSEMLDHPYYYEIYTYTLMYIVGMHATKVYIYRLKQPIYFSSDII